MHEDHAHYPAVGITTCWFASKLMGNQDLILAARKCHVKTVLRNTIGLPGTMTVRLSPIIRSTTSTPRSRMG